MSGLAPPDFLLETRGVHRQLDGFVVGAVFDRAGAIAGFAVGDGTLHMATLAGDWTGVPVHDGAILALAADTRAGWVTGGDDGRFRRVGLDGAAADIAAFGSKWVEQAASYGDPKGGLLACAVGRAAHVFTAEGERLRTFEHPSSVTGLAFDSKGKRIAASHYNGCSLWFIGAKDAKPRVMEWKGSHTGVALHPAGDAVVTSMQENSLHGWRLADGQHMRMSGYPGKTESMSFTRGGKWLATSGAESIVLWPFFGGGPMGKSPTELAGGDGVTCTRVACHPTHEAVAAGFSDGLVVVAEVASGRILPVAGTGRGRVSALGWSPDGSSLAFGTETGFAALVDFTKQ